MFARVLFCSLFLFFCSASYAGPVYPKLTGRVVDRVDMLSVAAENQLSDLFARHEKGSSNQVVVVTLPDLQGYDIETFGFMLGRAWGVGQKGKNNGVLLVVAKAERKIRIEVGYELEDILTDAISANIIHSIISPAFKRGHFEVGIERGSRAIVSALGGNYVISSDHRKPPKKNSSNNFWLFCFFFMVFFPILEMFLPAHLKEKIKAYNLGTSRSSDGFSRGSRGSRSGSSRGGSSRGGFSGGGGSFGGGGASGGW